MGRCLFVSFLLLGLSLLVACGSSASSDAGDTSTEPVIYASNYPVHFFAERIAGDTLLIRLPPPPAIDPAFWTPTDEDITALQAADLILLNGASYERWLPTVVLPGNILLDSSRAYRDRLRSLPVVATHSHGDSGAHSHAGTDFNTWLDADLAALQAQTIADGLTRVAPAQAAALDAGLTALLSELAALDKELQTVCQQAGEQTLLASHPVYGYLAAAYGLELRSLLWEPATMPDDAAWDAFAALRQETDANLMLYEDTPAPAIAERLRTAGVEPIVFRPCGNRPPSGDYFTEMAANIARLRKAFGE